MQHLPGVQELPAAPRSFHDVMCDPKLTCQARTLFAMISPPLKRHRGALEISREEIAKQLGYSLRETTRAIGELEHAKIIATKLRGQGKPKLFLFGENFDQHSILVTEGGSEDVTVIMSHSRSECGEISTSGWPPAASQEPLPLDRKSEPSQLAPLSRSHADTRGKLDPSGVVDHKDDDETTRARTRERLDRPQRVYAHATGRCTHHWNGSSSSLELKLSEWGVSEQTICRLLGDFPPGTPCKCIQCHGEPCTRIVRQLERMPARIDHASRRGEPIASPDGALVSAIVADWGWPKGYSTPRRWQVDQAEAQLRALDAPPAKSAAELQHEREINREKAIAYLRALPANERETIERSAEQLARTFPGKFMGKSPLDEILLGKIHKHAMMNGVTL